MSARAQMAFWRKVSINTVIRSAALQPHHGFRAGAFVLRHVVEPWRSGPLQWISERNRVYDRFSCAAPEEK